MTFDSSSRFIWLGKTAVVTIVFAAAMLQFGCAGSVNETSSNSVAAPHSSKLVITTTTLPQGQVGAAYSASLQASGGSAPYKWSVSSGTLPTGLALDSNTGALSGTPSADGSFGVTFALQDTKGASTKGSFSITVAAAVLALQITTAALPDGVVGSSYDAAVSVSGGTPPYTWSLASGALPSSVVLGATDGTVSGTPSSEGTFTPTVTVADAGSHSASKSYSFSVSGNELDKFGGVAAVSCPDPTKTDWNMQKMTIGGKTHWVFCDPLGHPFIKRGVYFITGDSNVVPGGTKSYNDITAAKYPSGAWADAQYARLKSWGFNAGGPGSYKHATDSVVQAANKEPFTEYVGWYTINKCINSNKLGLPANCKNLWNLLWPLNRAYDTNAGRNILDGFDPAWGAVLAADFAADKNLSIYKDSSYFIGGVLGESDQWSTSGAGMDFPTDPAGRAWGNTVWYVAQSAPRIMVNPRNSWAVYSDPANFTKKDFGSWLSSRYSGNIAALNAAWGASYTTFGSTGAQVTGTSLAGGGTSWSGSLTRTATVDRFSVLIKADGKAIGGDDGVGNLRGPGIAAGTVDYATGAVSVTLTASASSVTSDYWHDGWGTGSGVLDEAGNGHAWIPKDEKSLTGATEALKADFDDYLARYWAQVIGEAAQKFHAIAPTKLFLGLTGVGGFRAPARCGLLRGVAQVQDVVQLGGFDGSQAQADFIGKCMGDKPFTNWYSITANPDSDLYAYTISGGGSADVSSQAARATYYQKDLTNYWNNCNSSSGVCGWVGLDWWSLLSKSFWEHKNFGLISWRDNAFDGHEDTSASVPCSAPIGNLTCGGEEKTYGNFLGPATQTNQQIDGHLSGH